MHDPLLIDPFRDDSVQPRLPEEWRKQYLKRQVDRLPQDVTVAFDRVEMRRRENNQLRQALLSTQKKLDRANLKIWVLSLLVGPLLEELVRFAIHKIAAGGH